MSEQLSFAPPARPRPRTSEETWAVIKSAPDYEVSNKGRVRRLTRCAGTWPGRVLKPFGAGRNREYMCVQFEFRGVKHYVHHLVLDAFAPPKPSPEHECNHIDGDKANNHIENLEWVTRSENMQHCHRLGLRTPNHKYEEEDIHKIRRLYARGLRQYQISRRLGIPRQAIANVIYGRTWRHLHTPGIEP